jgi:hypothetical protein
MNNLKKSRTFIMKVDNMHSMIQSGIGDWKVEKISQYNKEKDTVNVEVSCTNGTETSNIYNRKMLKEKIMPLSIRRIA